MTRAFTEENDDIELPPDARPMRAQFADFAVQAGVVRTGDSIEVRRRRLCTRIVEKRAMIADQYPVPDTRDTVGDVLRARLYEPDPS